MTQQQQAAGKKIIIIVIRNKQDEKIGTLSFSTSTVGHIAESKSV